ncbi:MAG: hypothetical protein CMJ18_04520 [Phycisphaeraceae bacterium]|nr:hypothetical protein [Phycisphaeraceae bacterium]
MHTALNSCECAGDALHCSVERIWDIVLTLRLTEPGGAPIFGMATDDCHGYGAGHPVLGAAALPGRAWVMIRAGTLSATDLIDALEHGDFYCSSGVTLRNVERDGDGLRVEIDPVPGLRYRTRFIGTRRGYDPERRPVVDADGRTVRTTASYSDEVGSVFAETDDLAPTYRFEGDELYVRAVVTSDEDHHNPSWPGQKTQAWTQPAMP